MLDYRRWSSAAALLAAVFVTSASALAVPTESPPTLSCVADSVPPAVLAAGYTNLVGDLTLSCTGGVPQTLRSVTVVEVFLFSVANRAMLTITEPFFDFGLPVVSVDAKIVDLSTRLVEVDRGYPI